MQMFRVSSRGAGFVVQTENGVHHQFPSAQSATEFLVAQGVIPEEAVRQLNGAREDEQREVEARKQKEAAADRPK